MIICGGCEMASEKNDCDDVPQLIGGFVLLLAFIACVGELLAHKNATPLCAFFAGAVSLLLLNHRCKYTAQRRRRSV
jgi:hypothetical protein